MRLQFLVETDSKMCTTSSMLLSVFKGFKIIHTSTYQGRVTHWITVLCTLKQLYNMRGHVLQGSVLLKLSSYMLLDINSSILDFQ